MKQNSPTILIILVHSSYNAGDLALLDGLVNQLQRTFPSPRILIAANWPDEPYYQSRQDVEVVASAWNRVGEGDGLPVFLRIARFILGVLVACAAALGLPLRFCPRRWKDLFAAYQTCDAVIGVAGNQFYSTGRFGWPLPVNAFAVELAHLFKKPFYCMPQSIGPFKRRWERWLMRRVYGRARRLFFREHISVRLAQEIGIRPEIIYYAPDPAFGFPAAPRAEAARLLARYGYDEQAPKIGVTLIAPMGRSLDAQAVARYYAAMAALIRHLIEHWGARIYFFNQVTGPSRLEDDRTAVRQVLAALGEDAGRTVWVNETLTPQELKACYGLMDFMIASRLHSGIFALGQGVPALMIGYLTKTRGVLSAIGLEDWVIDLNAIQEDRLIGLAARAWLEREARAARLAERMDAVIAAAAQPLEWVAQDLGNLPKPANQKHR